MNNADGNVQSRTKKAMVIEGKGLKPKTAATIPDEEIEVSVPLDPGRSQEDLGVKAEFRDLVGTMCGNRKYSLFKLN